MTSIFSKIFSHVLDLCLRKYVEDNDHLTNFQYGFREGKSTTDCIFIFKSVIDCFINAGKKLYTTFVDFRKAFDLVHRNAVWFKLLACGFSNKFVNMIRKMYESVKVCIKSKNKMPDLFDSNVGLKQGEPLSPLLFIIFINDIVNDIASDNISTFTLNQIQIFMLLFADDTVLFAESPDDMQILLDGLKAYCDKWNISVNTEKTKVVVFKSGNRRSNVELYFDNILLEQVTSFTYLGVTLSSNGIFFQTQKSLAEQANKALYSLNKLLTKFT